MSKVYDACEKVRMYPETSLGLRQYIQGQEVKPSVIKTVNTAVQEWLAGKGVKAKRKA